MIKTVIVDDDSLVHVTLRSLIDWEKYDYKVVADFNSGVEAVKFISENPVDLLITDIKMPEIDGLELMRRLRQKSEMPLTVVLSGYDEFDLVRSAFRLGAYDYLLKSNINGESLEQLLNGLRENVFTQAGFTLSADPQNEVSAPVGLEDRDYIVVVFSVNEFPEAAQRFGGNLRERMEKPMLELVRQIHRLQGRIELFAKEPSRFELYYKVQDKSTAENSIMSVVDQIQGVWHDFMNLNVAAGVSSIVSTADIRYAAERCKTLCKLSVLKGIRGVCSENKYGELARAYDDVAADCDGLITALCGDDEAALDKETAQWFDSMSCLDEEQHFDRTLILIARPAERLMRSGTSFFGIFHEELERELSEVELPKDREIWLRNALRRVRTFFEEIRREKQKGDMERARDFMKDNFTNPELTLKTVADHVGFNEKYFSTRFTKECVCTFITYLNDLRIKRAQELLLHSNLKMYEISDAVRYANVEHFNHIFKKKLGISPRDFRQSGK